MNESKFNALIRLLDDNDPFVAESVNIELKSLGPSGIGRLEEAWVQNHNPLIQTRIEELINEIQVDHFTTDLYGWRKEGGRDLLDGWLMLNQVQYPTLNVQKYRGEVKRLATKIWLTMNPNMDDINKLSVINHQIYSAEHYNGNYQEPEKADSNYLSLLIDTRMGNSLSLSAFYYMICQSLDIPLQVVNFMGYYALRYFSKDAHFYIDAYNKGIFFTPQQVQDFLKKLHAEENVYHYKPLSNIYIVLHLMQQLQKSYESSGREAEAEKFRKLQHDVEIRLD